MQAKATSNEDRARNQATFLMAAAMKQAQSYRAMGAVTPDEYRAILSGAETQAEALILRGIAADGEAPNS